jgi:acetylornithine deacetylase
MHPDWYNLLKEKQEQPSPMPEHLKILTGDALEMLKALVGIPSFSREEDGTAAWIQDFLNRKGIPSTRLGNNIIARNKYFDSGKPTILLNSHHDTVKPDPGFTKNPFTAFEEDGRITGLGSNDAGASLVSLVSVFRHFYESSDLRYNLVLATTAEEEISGTGGIESVIPALPPIAFALVGEPTKMQMAIAERGLMVLDCTSAGKAGHAARDEGENAIYNAMKDIEKIRAINLDRVSTLLGPSRVTVTVIETKNKAHNVVPASCHFVVDARVNELYSFEEVIGIIREKTNCDVVPRSTRLRSTLIPPEHPIVAAGIKLGLEYYGSPTTSDKALMPFPALKIGPGDSARSHTADEYIYINEIAEGIQVYTRLLNEVL